MTEAVHCTDETVRSLSDDDDDPSYDDTDTEPPESKKGRIDESVCKINLSPYFE